MRGVLTRMAAATILVGGLATVDAAGVLLGELEEVLWSARSADELLEANVALERLRQHLVVRVMHPDEPDLDESLEIRWYPRGRGRR